MTYSGWIVLAAAASLPLPAAAQSTQVKLAVPEIAVPLPPAAPNPSVPTQLLLSPGIGMTRTSLSAVKLVVAGGVSRLASAEPPATAANNADSGPPYGSLPESIRPDFLEHLGFVEFTELADQKTKFVRNGRSFTNTPLGSGFNFGGRKLAADSDEFRALRREAFHESGWAFVPPGRRIRVSHDVRGREHWEYPEGMTFVDAIRVKAPGLPIFELRMVTRLAGGEWAFATYSYAQPTRPAPGERLHRALYDGTPPVEIAFGPKDDEQTTRFLRTNLKSCQACHFHNSVAGYQYEQRGADGAVDVMASRAATGPSGFVPTNDAIQGEWAHDYAKRHGHAPFAWAAAANPLASSASVATRLDLYVDGLK